MQSIIIERILIENPSAKFVFDIDGVLAAYEHQPYHHGYTESDWEQALDTDDPYKWVRPFRILQDFIAEHKHNCFTCSQCTSDREMIYKIAFVKRHYHLDKNQMFFVEKNEDKLKVLKDIYYRHPGIPPKHIVMVEDTVKVLDYIMENSEFSTLHISSFLQ